jgi:hypothetical protein
MSEESPPTLDQAIEEANVEEAPAQEAPANEPSFEQPQEGPPPEEQAEPTQQESAPTEQPFVYEYNGKQYELSPQEVKELIDMSVNAYSSAAQKRGQPQEQQPQEQAPQTPQAPDFSSPEALQKYVDDAIKRGVEAQTKDVVQDVQKWRQETAAKEMMQRIDSAVSAHPELKQASTDRDDANLIKSTIVTLATQAGLSVEQAAQRMAKHYGKFGAAKNQEYVQTKIKQAGQKVEGAGGSSPAPGAKQLGPDDLWNGTIKNATHSDLIEAMVGE